MIIIFDSFVGSDKTPGRGFKMNFVSIGTGEFDDRIVFMLILSKQEHIYILFSDRTNN